MQIELPDHDQQATGYRGLFIIGWRQTDAKLAERTGTVILKRTYDIDPKNGTLLPSTKPWPVFLSDQPDNLVSGCGLVKGYNSPVQAIDFGEPLVNQEFVLSCLAWTDAAKASTSGMRVEADGAILKIVEEPGRPWNVKQKRKSFSWAGKWEQSDQKNNPTIMKLFLPSGTVDGHNVFYEDIKVFNAFRYEHDLASYKPEADVIVLGCANIPHGSRAEIAVGDQIWFARTVEATNRRHLFGGCRAIKRAGKRKQASFQKMPMPIRWRGCQKILITAISTATSATTSFCEVSCRISKPTARSPSEFTLRLHWTLRLLIASAYGVKRFWQSAIFRIRPSRTICLHNP